MTAAKENMLGDLGNLDGAPEDDAFAVDLPIDDDDEPSSIDPVDIHDDGDIAAPAHQTGAPTRAAPKRKVVMALPIDIVVAVGRARPLLSELAGLRRDSVLALDSQIDDPVELLVGDKVIARGELQEIEPETGRLGVRLTEVADPQEGA